MSEYTVEEINANIQGYSDEELVNLSQDERQGVKDAVTREQERRNQVAQEAAQAQVDEKGERVRYEDDPANFPQAEGFEPAPVSAVEVPLEESRKDHTTVLSTDPPDYS